MIFGFSIAATTLNAILSAYHPAGCPGICDDMPDELKYLKTKFTVCVSGRW